MPIQTHAGSLEADVIHEPGRDADLLYISLRSYRGELTYLAADGSYRAAADGAVADPPMGFRLPAGSRRALIEALAEHADAGEVRELRRALELAEKRVQQLIDHSLS